MEDLRVRVRLDWYRASKFSWEPLLEPFESALTVRLGGNLATLSLTVAESINANVTDAALRSLLDNVRAGMGALEEQEKKSSTPLFPICGDPISPICQKTFFFCSFSAALPRGRGEAGGERIR